MKELLLFAIVVVFGVFPVGCSENSPVEPQIKISRDDPLSAPVGQFAYDNRMMTMTAGYTSRRKPDAAKRILVVGVYVFEQRGVDLDPDFKIDYLWLINDAHFRFQEPPNARRAVDHVSIVYWTPIDYQGGTSLVLGAGVYDKDGGLMFVRSPENILRELSASSKEQEW